MKVTCLCGAFLECDDYSPSTSFRTEEFYHHHEKCMSKLDDGYRRGMMNAAEIADRMAGFNGIIIKNAIREEADKA